jgi:Pro-kumamolisin, activation domain
MARSQTPSFRSHDDQQQRKGESVNHKLLSVLRMAAMSALVLAFLPSAHAQFSGNPAARPLVTSPVVNTNLVRLTGNVRPEANTTNDLGAVPDTFPMDHMLIQLQRPPTEEAALRQLIDQLHDPSSPNYHQWLTPEQLGTQFGPAASDIQQVTSWLQTQGFRVNLVYPSGMTIDFSGNAGEVGAAFRTEIHNVADEAPHSSPTSPIRRSPPHWGRPLQESWASTTSRRGPGQKEVRLHVRRLR